MGESILESERKRKQSNGSIAADDEVGAYTADGASSEEGKKLPRDKISAAHMVVLWFGGLRGSVSFALAVSIPPYW